MDDLKLFYKVFLTVSERKSSSGKNYTCFMLFRDYGYKTEVISFDVSFISEALGISVAELRFLKFGTYSIN